MCTQPALKSCCLLNIRKSVVLFKWQMLGGVCRKFFQPNKGGSIEHLPQGQVWVDHVPVKLFKSQSNTGWKVSVAAVKHARIYFCTALVRQLFIWVIKGVTLFLLLNMWTAVRNWTTPTIWAYFSYYYPYSNVLSSHHFGILLKYLLDK